MFAWGWQRSVTAADYIFICVATHASPTLSSVTRAGLPFAASQPVGGSRLKICLLVLASLLGTLYIIQGHFYSEQNFRIKVKALY
jgi:hypothetical protein